jgi:hypothetical protein
MENCEPFRIIKSERIQRSSSNFKDDILNSDFWRSYLPCTSFKYNKITSDI